MYNIIPGGNHRETSSFSYHDRAQTGRLLTCATSDVGEGAIRIEGHDLRQQMGIVLQDTFLNHNSQLETHNPKPARETVDEDFPRNQREVQK